MYVCSPAYRCWVFVFDMPKPKELADTLEKPTHFPHVEQKNRETVRPLSVSVSLYSFNSSSPEIWTLSVSIPRLAPYAEPDVLRQLWQWHR